MELDQLKSAWNDYSKKKIEEQSLSLEQLQPMLHRRTVEITVKIKRNIRIGLFIMFLWITFNFTVDFLLNPFLNNYFETAQISTTVLGWSTAIEAFVYALIILSLVIFLIKFNKINSKPIDICNLKATLQTSVSILNLYQRMFYLVMIIFLLLSTAMFSSGFCLSLSSEMKKSGIEMSSLSVLQWVIVVALFVGALFVLIALFYGLFTLFYKRLYGRFHKQLKQTLAELTE